MTELILAGIGFAVGGAVVWLLARAHYASETAGARTGAETRVVELETREKELQKQLTERQLEIGDLRAELETERVQRVQAETRDQAARESLESERRSLTETRERLSDAFKALSADALRQSNTQFLELASQTLDAQLGPRETKITALLDSLQGELRRAENYVRELEGKREHAYASLDTRLQELVGQSRDLGHETSNLVSALRGSQTRGRWGEIALQKIVELAGMTEHCDFDKQVSVESDSARFRPDMVVHLPDHREIVVDAKVPLDDYEDAERATTEEQREQALGRHAQAMRRHMTQLADKAYGRQLSQSPNLVVMFIQLESSVAAAFRTDGKLLSDAMGRRVVIATPTTLLALLLAIAHGWQQQQLGENAEEIRRLGKELYDRLGAMAGHVRTIGHGLEEAVNAYNDAVGSLERRVLPAARRFHELGVGERDKPLPSLDPVDQTPKRITATELGEQLAIEPGSKDPEADSAR